MKRPTDKHERFLYTYLVSDDNRLRLDISPHPYSMVNTLLGNVHTTSVRAPLAFCKRIHRYTHASESEMQKLCSDASIMIKSMKDAVRAVCDACEICAKNGRPKPARKVSLTHVNAAFNQELQLDFSSQRYGIRDIRS